MSSGIDSAPAPAEQSARHVGFGDRLHRRVTERRSQLVLGLDPDPMRLWPRAIELVGGTGATSDPPADRAARAVAAHCALAIETSRNAHSPTAAM